MAAAAVVDPFDADPADTPKLVLEFPSVVKGEVKKLDGLSADEFRNKAERFSRSRSTSNANGTPEMLMEARSSTAHLVDDWHKNAFVGSAVYAFANHYPLELKPDHFWLLFLQGVSKHVELHAEQLRSKFVNHSGKKEIVVRADDFQLGSPTNDWERVFPQFVEQIDANTVADVVPRLESRFSTSTPTDIIAGKITLMDVCKSFFQYTVMTMCGYPSITLHGTRDDWVQLRDKITGALTLCEPGFASSWGAALSSVTDKFIKTFDGERDEDFWQSIVKVGGTTGSGARTWYSGWLNVFFPYGTGDMDTPFTRNKFCVPYRADAGYVKQGLKEDFYCPFSLDQSRPPRDPEDMTYQGLEPQTFPPGFSETPAKWDFMGAQYTLAFRAGFTGVTQNPVTLAVTPAIGWLVLRSPAPAAGP